MKNKYNIRAIRNELDSHIRYASWNRFRLRFQSLQFDLARAVVEIRGHHHSNTTTLLHAICRCCSSVPLDILEAVLRVCPPHLLLQRYPVTPLSTVLEHYHRQSSRQASLTELLDTLILHDTTASRESLYIKDRAGNTPILHAVRRKQEHDNSLDWDVVHLLVQHDNDTRQTLLIPSKKKNRLPLWYVVANHQDEDDCNFLEYMLLQTYHALEIQQGREGLHLDMVVDDGMHQHHETSEAFSGFFSNKSSSSSSPSCGARKQDHVVLLAILACAHLLGSKNTLKIFATFHLGNRGDSFQWQQHCLQDSDGNTLLHHACRAVESNTFLEPVPVLGSASGCSCFLLQYIIDGYPQALVTSNAQGQLPLHLAIKAQKGWEFLQHLCHPHVVLQRTTKDRQLALHLALAHCPNRGYYSCKEIMELRNAYPEAVSIVDGKTGLFAFQLAASVGLPYPTDLSTRPVTFTKTNSKRTHHEQNQTTEKDQLSLIYFFLRSSPEVILQYC